MPGFDMSGYVDVAERERLLFERYPDARIQVELAEVRDESGCLVAWKAKATLWRSPEDTLPVCDWAVEPVPGKTPYTKDSEAMNASTSAVGRAIVLAGFETKKIASADEVRNRQAPAEPDPEDPTEPTAAQRRKLGALTRELGILEEGEDWAGVAKDYMNAQFGKASSKELTRKEMSKLIDELESRKTELLQDVPI